MVDGANIMKTSLIVICNYIIYEFGKCAIFPEEAVHNLIHGILRQSAEHMNMIRIRVWKRSVETSRDS